MRVDGSVRHQIHTEPQPEPRPSIHLPTRAPSRLATKPPTRHGHRASLPEVSACEALYYTHLDADSPVPSPKCYYVDYNVVSGEFILLSELMPFGEGSGEGAILPLKHRVRDPPSLEEQMRFVSAGGRYANQIEN